MLDLDVLTKFLGFVAYGLATIDHALGIRGKITARRGGKRSSDRPKA